MKPSDKEIPRSRRPRTLPPSAPQAGTSLLPTPELDVVVPRFYDQAAQLSALSVQVRTLSQNKDKAVAAGRLARQLAHHGIETRDALALGEKSLAIFFDPDLGLDVARWWASAGDPNRGARLAESVIDELPEGQRRQALLSIAKTNIRLGHCDHAVRALRRVIDLAPEDPTAYELFGSLGFWSEHPKDECARSFLRAAELRRQRGDDSNAFESRLRAFEVDPSCTEAATSLSTSLRERGRVGAADEIFREHLRTASAAQRAAHHQRAFYSSLSEDRLENCIESALEAELDIDVDVKRVCALVLEAAPMKQDFESFLWKLISEGTWGQSNMLASWLMALCEIHRGANFSAEILLLADYLAEHYSAETLPTLDLSDNDQAIRHLRSRLVTEHDFELESELRLELTRRLCVKSLWDEALLVLSPLLQLDEVSLAVAAFGAALGGRTSDPVMRVRSMVALAPWLPAPAGAVTYAVAAERLLNLNRIVEAHEAADAAVEALPTNERAIATQALVALRAPDGASASLLEHSLSVLVARSDACSLLSESASQRGSSRLALTWAGRALALRPGDVECARRYLQHACALIDPSKIVEALEEVMDQPVPLKELEQDVCDCLTLLKPSGETQVIQIGLRLLGTFSLEQEAVFRKLRELADTIQVNELLAALTEAKLIVAESNERANLYLQLAKYRWSSGQLVAAARALRRAQLSGSSEAEVKELRARISTVEDPDALLALLEIDADLEEGLSSEQRAQRLLLLGCARWDMAHDVEQAIVSWLRAADFDPERGLDLFVHYLRNFAGSERAAEHLKEAARNTEDPVRSGRLLGLSAREYLRLGRNPEAFRLASAALERAPLLAELLAIAEAACDETTLDELERLYQLLADGALGKYGERAAHYRAARQLEKRGALEAALPHACAAFEVEPAEGVAYVLMARLADATAGHMHLLNSLQKVADTAPSDRERARWLSLAAALSDTESIGRTERLEILFRATAMQPTVETLDDLFDGIAHCLADEPEQRDALWDRFVRLCRDVFLGSQGPDGARRCLVIAVASVTHFEQPDFAVEAAAAAVRCDTEVAEYCRLLPFVHQLAGIVGPAAEFVEAVRTTEDEKHTILGPDLARLAGMIAQLLGEKEVQAELAVRAASHAPEDAGLVNWARGLAQGSGRADLIASIDELLPAPKRAEALLERLPSMTSNEALDGLLDLDVQQLEDPVREQILKEQGTRLEAIGRTEEAAEVYRSLLASDPDSMTALLGLERHAESHGNHEDLLKILGRRIELSADQGEIRRLTLRRAAVLETKLGRAPEARKLLQAFLGQGEDRAALRLLADSWQRTGDHTEAAELWERVLAVALDSIEADDAAYRAAMCFSKAGLPRRAKVSLEKIKKPTLAHLELSLEVARTLGDKDDVYSAVVRLCKLLHGDHVRQGTLLLEAANLALMKKRVNDAERCANRALELIPASSEARLLVGRIRAQNGSLSTTLQAEQMRQLLSGTESLSSASDREMAAFLRAKSLMLSGKKHEAEELLESAVADQGQRPLLCALLSEIIVDEKRALRLLDVALGGECYGFFSEGELLLRAGSLAQELGDFERARGLISAVAEDDPLRVRAARALEQLAVAQVKQVGLNPGNDEPLTNLVGDGVSSELVVPANEPEGEDGSYAMTKEQETEIPGNQNEQSETESADLTVEEIRRAAREEHRRAALAVSERQELAGPRRVRRSSRPALRAVVAATLTDESLDSLRVPALPTFSADELSGGGLVPKVVSDDSDGELLLKLEQGDLGAGLELFGRLQSDKSRSRDAVIVAQHLALLNPADAQLLGSLVTAAYRDGNEALAIAARHVLGAYGAGEPISAPPLHRVLDQHGAGLTLLKQVQGPANEALAIIWDYAGGFFRKELSDYGISGLERVAPNAGHTIFGLCQGVSRVTGLAKIPVFRLSGSEEISIQVALIHPPSVIVTGEIDEVSLELAFHFGAMMAACAPEHALVFGADRRDVQNLLEALALSFGSRNSEARPSSDVTKVAALLWESVPARAQRRLSQICSDPNELSYATLSGYSRLAVRRAGLMACGDLPTAVDDACGECGISPPRSLSELAHAVRICPAVADLFQLSLSSEYAQIRFEEIK